MKKQKILITGDTINDHHIYKGNIPFPESESRNGTRIITKPGGAKLLYELVKHICKKKEADIRFLDCPGKKNNAFAVWELCPGNHKNEDACKDNPKKWRVTEMLGYDGLLPPISKQNTRKSQKQDYPEADIVVIDDGALGFRANAQLWPQFLREKKKNRPWLILKMSYPVGRGDLWAELRDGNFLSKTILVVSADDLRRNEVMITSGRSWEQTVQDILNEIKTNAHLQQLTQCRHIIIHFRCEGALWIDNPISAKNQSTMFFDPGFLEGEWEQEFTGEVLGKTTCFTAGIVCTLSKNPAPSKILHEGISRGLCAMRALLKEGHGKADSKRPAFPLDTVAASLMDKDTRNKFNGVKIPDKKVPDDENWSFIGIAAGNDKRPLYDKARLVAQHGTKIFREIPFGRFGTLYTVDRTELESMNGIRRLINHYIHNDKGKKPLSLGVFGPPGSGKSFGIKQIAKGVLGNTVSILEFNLSQFDGHAMLIAALHQVRDAVLKGKQPVVFWDEFDSNDLNWLQYLLAPMQDGTFLEGQINHPIGKCIFVFAGGTSPTMEQFIPSRTGDAEKYDIFCKKKGPDFVSRLRGYLNVLGPNQKQCLNQQTKSLEPDPRDTCFPIRRALLVRVMAGCRENEPLNIDFGLLNAFLKIDTFKHGARSMETIIALTAGGKRGQLLCSDLPPREQISLHVDYDAFMRLIEEDRPFQTEYEYIAPHIHEFYRKLAVKEGWTVNYDMDYDMLPPAIKADNVAAAERISHVLSLVGMQVVPQKKGRKKTVSEKIRKKLEQEMELLAEVEHDGWMKTKLENGWQQAKTGETRNDNKKIHECLIPYADLSEKNKEKDRDAVRNYPVIVAKAGYTIIFEK